MPTLVGARVQHAEIHRPEVISVGALSRNARTTSRGAFLPPAELERALLVSRTIASLSRRGKQILFTAAPAEENQNRPSPGMVIHLGMTGNIALHQTLPTPLPPHTHIVWHLTTAGAAKCHMLFVDPRRFGGIILVPDVAKISEPHNPWHRLGPDALTITPDQWITKAHTARRAIKAVLLDQHILAGVGNIYADEALFRAGIRPSANASRLSVKRLASLSEHITAILREAIDAGGSSLRDYYDAQGNPGAFVLRHNVYGKAGQPCPRCATTIRSSILAQRTTAWCPKCQG
jgi:formamidopyrimidine-DNA glycosylase